MLNDLEKQRYARQIALSEIGEAGQLALKQAKVICIGAGGLGSSALWYLAAMGIGTLGIMDPDVVDRSNLSRQTLYREADLGRSKAECAAARCLELNPHLELISYPFAFDSSRISLIAEYDWILEGTDQLSVKYLVSDACHHLNKPLILAAISTFSGICAVFGGSQGPCYRCLFPDLPQTPLLTCVEAGVLSVVPGLVGLVQATELVKAILGLTQLSPGEGKVIHLDTLSSHMHPLTLSVNEDCPICSERGTPAQLAHAYSSPVCTETLSLTPRELKLLLDQKAVQLMDVRTLPEREEDHIGGLHIPIQELEARLSELNPQHDWVIYCHLGGRSSQALNLLKSLGFSRVRHLQGGLEAWRKAYPLKNLTSIEHD